MPIRSPRGRSAAYRPIWQWPLRSPARLALTGIVALAVVAGVSYGIGAARGPERSGLPAPRSATVPTGIPVTPGYPVSTPAVTALPPVPDLRPTTLPLSAAPAEGLQVVTRWAAAWTRPPPGTTTAQWLDGLRPYTTDEYLGVLSGVDPANVPATKVTSIARAVEVSPRSMRVQVPTDALTLLVTVVQTDAGWRVSGYDKA